MDNWNCDGSGRNRCCAGEVRLYPTGKGELHGNMIYCRACFAEENGYNARRVKQGNVDPDNFPQINWETAKRYKDAEGNLIDD